MSYRSERIACTHGSIDMVTGGEGRPLLILHRDIGRPAWGRFQDRLAETHRVLMPSLPGFDGSDRIEWLRNPPDLAAAMGSLLEQIGDGPIDVIGLGFGGWLAAEIAARDPSRISRLFLHAPLGVKPPEGEIADFVLWETLAYIGLGFEDKQVYDAVIADLSNAQRDHWENNREIVLRIAWKPAMYDPALPHLLRDVSAPTRIAWSRGDAIVPRSAAALYATRIPTAELVDLPKGGHHAEIETPDLLADCVLEFLKANVASASRHATAAE